MSKANWINKDGYFTIFHLVKSGVDMHEIARVTHRGYKTIRRAKSYLTRAYAGTLKSEPSPRENSNLCVWALEFAKLYPSSRTGELPAPEPPQNVSYPNLPEDKQALFIALLLSELFYLAASGNTSLPFPPTNYDGQQTDCLGFRMGGIRTAVYAMDCEDEYLKWRKYVLGDYDIASEFEEAES